MKAMLLAAGRGSRLRPLTDHTPKALLRVAGEYLIERHLRRLAAVGVLDIVINLHHLGDQIASALNGAPRSGARLHFLHEPTLLDTGGAIVNALPLLDDGPFILLSADVWTDYPLDRLLAPLLPATLARLVLVQSHLGADFGFASVPPPDVVAPLVVNPSETFTYASLGVLDPALFRQAPAGAFPLRDLLFPALAAGRLAGERYTGPWFNVGDLRELQALQAFVGDREADPAHGGFVANDDPAAG